MAKASDNEFPSILLADTADPAAPADGHHRLFVDTDEKLKMIDHASLVTDFTPSAGLLNKYNATTAPAVTDDSGDGYAVGSIWIDVTGDKAYICVDASVGAAIWTPFEAAGGADLSGFRLSGVADDPGDIALGTYGDEFEYEDTTALTAVWTPRSCSPYAAGSAFVIRMDALGDGIFRDATAFASDWEIAFLLQTTARAMGIAVIEADGDGLSVFNDGGTSYLSHLAAYGYNGNDSSFGTPTAAWEGALIWWALRKSGTDYRLRHSFDGSSWTTDVAAKSRSITVDRVGLIGSYASGDVTELTIVHRMVYGTADLGL